MGINGVDSRGSEAAAETKSQTAPSNRYQFGTTVSWPCTTACQRPTGRRSCYHSPAFTINVVTSSAISSHLLIPSSTSNPSLPSSPLKPLSPSQVDLRLSPISTSHYLPRGSSKHIVLVAVIRRPQLALVDSWRLPSAHPSSALSSNLGPTDCFIFFQSVDCGTFFNSTAAAAASDIARLRRQPKGPKGCAACRVTYQPRNFKWTKCSISHHSTKSINLDVWSIA
jgi:hypothetical protein